MKDNINMSHRDDESLAIKSIAGEPIQLRMSGQITDRIYKNGELIDEIVGHNIIVNQFLKLIMALCRGEDGYAGIQYWAVGSGDASWDTSMPSPEINASRLTTELGRVPITKDEIKFLTASGAESSTPTGIVQIKHMFGPNDCNGKWREFGIFGGNATDVANSGLMINKKHHAVITKTNEISIERTMRFTLSLI